MRPGRNRFTRTGRLPPALHLLLEVRHAKDPLLPRKGFKKPSGLGRPAQRLRWRPAQVRTEGALPRGAVRAGPERSCESAEPKHRPRSAGPSLSARRGLRRCSGDARLAFAPKGLTRSVWAQYCSCRRVTPRISTTSLLRKYSPTRRGPSGLDSSDADLDRSAVLLGFAVDLMQSFPFIRGGVGSIASKRFEPPKVKLKTVPRESAVWEPGRCRILTTVLCFLGNGPWGSLVAGDRGKRARRASRR